MVLYNKGNLYSSYDVKFFVLFLYYLIRIRLCLVQFLDWLNSYATRLALELDFCVASEYGSGVALVILFSLLKIIAAGSIIKQYRESIKYLIRFILMSAVILKDVNDWTEYKIK